MKKLLKKIPLIAIIFPPIGLILFYKWVLNNLLKKEKEAKIEDEKITIKVDTCGAEEFAKAINRQVFQDKLEAWKYELLNKNSKSKQP